MAGTVTKGRKQEVMKVAPMVQMTDNVGVPTPRGPYTLMAPVVNIGSGQTMINHGLLHTHNHCFT